MYLRTPPWWYRKNPGLSAAVLAPLSLAYMFAAETRMRLGTPYRSKLPVFCIGNFTAGGAGKTPHAVFAAKRLQTMGHTPAFLTRGHGGHLTGPHPVCREKDSAADVGDEPLILAATAPTILARDRAAGARFIEATDATAIIMDDGLQNPSLAKSITLAIVDAEVGLGNNMVIPAGPLRARRSFQFRRTDAVIVSKGYQTASLCPHVKASLDTFTGPTLCSTTRPTKDTDWLRNTAVVAYAGIARPDKFFATLTTCGARIAHQRTFPDHYIYQENDAAALLELAEKTGAQLVTTEKDWLRLPPDNGPLADLREHSAPLPIEITMDDTNLSRFDALLKLGLTRG